MKFKLWEAWGSMRRIVSFKGWKARMVGSLGNQRIVQLRRCTHFAAYSENEGAESKSPHTMQGRFSTQSLTLTRSIW